MDQFIEFAIKNWLLFAALAAILALLIGGEILRKVRGVSTLNPTQALQLINNQDAVVLDIRDSGDYRAGHIPQARHIPLNNLKDRLSELEKFKDRPTIVYCQSGSRSSTACALLKKNQFMKVYHLGGGIMAWRNANLPVHKT